MEESFKDIWLTGNINRDIPNNASPLAGMPNDSLSLLEWINKGIESKNIDVYFDSAIKNPVRVATTENITLSGLLTIDGITLEGEDRVLVKNQTDKKQNGIYVAKYGAWERSEDLANEFHASGVTVIVSEGTLSNATIYICNNPKGGDIVGEDDLQFIKTLDLISVDNVTIESVSGQIRIKNSGVNKDKINTNVADQSTIVGGNGTSLSVRNYTPITNTTLPRRKVITGVVIGGGTSVETIVNHGLNTKHLSSVDAVDEESIDYQRYILDWRFESLNEIKIISNGTAKTLTLTITG